MGDAQRETRKQNSKLVGERTTIIIAHRLSTVKHANRIIVVGNQGIREAGTHDELMKKKCLCISCKQV